MKHYFFQVLIALDQLANAVLCGWADETLSSCAWRMEKQGKPWGRIWRPIIDGVFRCFGQKDHCRNSYWAERERAQMPPELRTQSWVN